MIVEFSFSTSTTRLRAAIGSVITNRREVVEFQERLLGPEAEIKRLKTSLGE